MQPPGKNNLTKVLWFVSPTVCGVCLKRFFCCAADRSFCNARFGGIPVKKPKYKKILNCDKAHLGHNGVRDHKNKSGRLAGVCANQTSVNRQRVSKEDAHGFICKHCGNSVSAAQAGTQHRNHCPQCLFSLHLDNHPGDRAAQCRGMMEPIGVWVRKGGEWAVIHRCHSCGTLSSNRIAADDNPLLLMSLAVKPLSMPPFPLDYSLLNPSMSD